MKRSLYVLMLALFPIVSQAEVILAPVDHLFVPQGFDNTDTIEVIVTGTFPNPCFVRDRSDVVVKDDKIFITVTARRREDESSDLCEPMAVPYTEDIAIGNLQGGNYEIIVNEKLQKPLKEKLEVAVSRNDSVDDHLYPIIEYVDLGFMGGISGDAMIVASTPSDCVAFDRVEYISNNKDTLAILPIMKRVSPECTKKRTRIEIPIKFDLQRFSYKDLLLYVRSIEGKSVNAIVRR